MSSGSEDTPLEEGAPEGAPEASPEGAPEAATSEEAAARASSEAATSDAGGGNEPSVGDGDGGGEVDSGAEVDDGGEVDSGGESGGGSEPRPAPARRRRDPSLAPPVVRAQARYVRTSARKARLVCDHIRGKTVDEARAILAHTPRAVARDWSKLLESAVANAEHNHELVGEDLFVKAVHADEGPTIKRFRPRAMGRATKIRKRTSHLTILLTPKE